MCRKQLPYTYGVGKEAWGSNSLCSANSGSPKPSPKGAIKAKHNFEEYWRCFKFHAIDAMWPSIKSIAITVPIAACWNSNMIKQNYRSHYNFPAVFLGGGFVGWHKGSVMGHRCFMFWYFFLKFVIKLVSLLSRRSSNLVNEPNVLSSWPLVFKRDTMRRVSSPSILQVWIFLYTPLSGPFFQNLCAVHTGFVQQSYTNMQP